MVSVVVAWDASVGIRPNGVTLSRAALAQDTTERGDPADAHAADGRRLQRRVRQPVGMALSLTGRPDAQRVHGRVRAR